MRSLDVFLPSFALEYLFIHLILNLISHLLSSQSPFSPPHFSHSPSPFRTRMQTQSHHQPAQFTSTLNCVQQIYSKFGIQGIYKGQVTTMMREWQGYGAYFMLYEYLMQRQRGSDVPTWKVMMFGALSGYAMWIPIFPLDSIKSRLQTDHLDITKRQYRGFVDCFQQTMKRDGIRGFYRGFVPCLLRAAPVNGRWMCSSFPHLLAATFVAYEYARSYFT